MKWLRVSLFGTALTAFADIGARWRRGLPCAGRARAKDFACGPDPLRVSTRRENEFVADAKIQLLGLYRRHPRMIAHPDTAYIPLDYAALCHFVSQKKNRPLPELMAGLARLVPGTDISPVRRRQYARAKMLRREISALNDLRASLAAERPAMGQSR